LTGEYIMSATAQEQPFNSLHTQDNSQRRVTAIGLTIFITGILYYCFAYLLRVYPNIMEDQLLTHFHTTSLGYSMLTVFYYVAYAPMQIPVGVSVDKIGPRRSLLAACLIAMLGVVLFASSNTMGMALFGRFLVGLGAAFAYVTALKLATLWLPRKYFATATGFVTGLGMVAAGFTEIGFTEILNHSGYHAALRTPLYIGLGLFILILLVIKDKPKNETANEQVEESSPMSFSQLWRYVRLIMSNKQMWLIGFIGCLLYMPSSVFLDAWAIPYLQAADKFTPLQAADGASMMLTGWIVSSFLAGILSDVLGSRKIPLICACIGATVISSLLIFSHSMSPHLVLTLLFLFGFACGPHPLCFTLSKENWTRKISGTAVAFANFVIMMGGFVMQPVVGKLLNEGWHGTFVAGQHIRLYTAHDYVLSLALLPVGLLLATLLSFFVRETYTKKNNEAEELNKSINQLREY
jgi:sugar phosphate permease